MEIKEYLDIAKWPLAVVVIAVAAIIILKDCLGKLFERITAINNNGVQFGDGNQQNTKKISAKELMKSMDNELLLELENLLKLEYLDKVTHESPEEKQELLLKLLASESLGRLFDQTYNLIYGSQIRALQHLNTFAGRFVDKEIVKPFYDEARTQWLTFYKDYSFESWIVFLENMILVKVQNNQLVITKRGQGFLKYLIDQGLSHNKTG